MIRLKKIPILINVGENFSRQYKIETINYTVPTLINKTVEATLRKPVSSIDTPISFTVVIDDESTGIFTISLDNTDTEIIKDDFYVYDIIVTENDSGNKYRAFQGNVGLNLPITNR